MKRRLFSLIVFLCCTVLLSLNVFPAEQSSDKESLAKKLVHDVGGIKENDLVLISGGADDLELLENLSTHVRMVGAHPLVTIDSPRANRLYFDKVDPKWDSQAPEFTLKLSELITASFTVEFGQDPGLLSDVPPARFVALSKANSPAADRLMKRNVRRVFLGNGLYPNAATAKLFDVTQDQLSKIFWAGVNTDYARLQSRAAAVRAILASGKELHITNPNGTDLKVRIEGRPVLVSDGVISPEDVKQGGAATQVWLPAGEVYVVPVAGTAEGKVVSDNQFYEDKQVEGLTLTYKAGKLVSMTAKSGMERLKANYDAAGDGKDLFGYVDLGVNEDVQLVPGSKMNAWMAAGMVTLGVGNNGWTGAGNYVSFGLPSFLQGCTVKVDGKLLVENGKLKL